MCNAEKNQHRCNVITKSQSCHKIESNEEKYEEYKMRPFEENELFQEFK